ncbi:MAG TPA: polynucleotide adenylyltransferase, partial [Moorella mulderi]|nr:polynucleotide adenylyltransferase [Moorella mulderi]
MTAAGGRVYLVGGVLRDLLLGREPQDRDYCVTGLTGEEFQNLFPQAALVGKDFPVFILKGDTYALARREKKTAKGYRGFEIFSSPQVSIEEDLKRRDLTVNAMALDLSTGQLIDPYGGLEDLRRGILRAVSPAFAEDPLRVYRTARLAAHLGFRVDP